MTASPWMRTLLVMLLLGIGLAGPAAAKVRKDSGCYDRCDRSLLNCKLDGATCARDRNSCVVSCDPDPAHPGAKTRQRLAESDGQIRQRLAGGSADKLSQCAVRCEDAAEACGQVNSATVCADARKACLRRCPGKGGKH